MPTTNKDMSDMMRRRRREMEEIPEESVYTGPDAEVDVDVEVEPEASTSESPEGMRVAAPGEPSTGERFEYEPLTDVPGAWVVYPPGVPCDDAEYRVQLDRPAGKDDFAKMQQALDDAGAVSSEPAPLETEEEEIY